MAGGAIASFTPGRSTMAETTTWTQGYSGQTAAQEHTEGTVARTIEQQTAKLPSDVFLWAACGSIFGALAFHAMNRPHLGLFLGQLAPTFLLLGVYNKIVKLHSSD